MSGVRLLVHAMISSLEITKVLSSLLPLYELIKRLSTSKLLDSQYLFVNPFRNLHHALLVYHENCCKVLKQMPLMKIIFLNPRYIFFVRMVKAKYWHKQSHKPCLMLLTKNSPLKLTFNWWIWDFGFVSVFVLVCCAFLAWSWDN